MIGVCWPAKSGAPGPRVTLWLSLIPPLIHSTTVVATSLLFSSQVLCSFAAARPSPSFVTATYRRGFSSFNYFFNCSYSVDISGMVHFQQSFQSIFWTGCSRKSTGVLTDVSEVPESGTSLLFPFPVVSLSTVNSKIKERRLF